MKLSEIAQRLGAELLGADRDISGPGTIQEGRPDEIGFLAEAKYQHHLPSCQLGAIITAQPLETPIAQLRVREVKRAWRQALLLFAPPPPPARISPRALLGEALRLGTDCHIAAGAVLEDGVELGDRVRIGANAVLERGVRIGADSVIGAGAKILERSVIGARALIGANAVIGSRGFGLNFEDGRWLEIPQLGGVRIGDDVEIGAATTIDCGAVRDTVLEDGVKLDNHIQVGHNVHIGAHTIIAGCTVIAGSTRFGQYCVVGGACVFTGHIEICDGAQFTGHSSISKSITAKGLYSSGFPAILDREWKRFIAKLRLLTKD